MTHEPVDPRPNRPGPDADIPDDQRIPPLDRELPGFEGDRQTVTPPKAAPKSTAGVLGVDRSHHDGVIDWAAHAAAGVKFAYLKCTEAAGTNLFVDPMYETNRDAARAVSIIVGPYHFGRPASDPRQSARDLLAHAGWRPGDLAPVLDTEAADGYSAAHCHAWVHNFADELAQPMGQYTGHWFWDTYVTGAQCVYCTPRPLWLGPNRPLSGTWPYTTIEQNYNVTIGGTTGDVNHVTHGTLGDLLVYATGNPAPTPQPAGNPSKDDDMNLIYETDGPRICMLQGGRCLHLVDPHTAGQIQHAANYGGRLDLSGKEIDNLLKQSA